MVLAQANKIEVYTDGNCNLCRWMRAHVEPLDSNHRVEWLDYNDPEILKRAAPHTRAAMADEMHARLPDYTLFGVPPPCDANGACQLHK